MDPRTGLVVAGAGARGAYEAGALSVLLPRMERAWSAPSVLVGTSAGAINAAGLAGLAHHGADHACSVLEKRWRSVELSDVFHLADSVVGAATYSGQVMGVPGRLLGRVGLPPRLTGLVDTTPLEETLEPLVDWDDLHTNVENGTLDAVAVTTTSVATGGSVVFVERGPGVPLPEPDLRRDITYVDARLDVSHLLASAAVPGLFRPVWLDDPPGWYVDGGVRMNTPLKPALKLGSTRLGVVSSTPAVPAPAAPSSPDEMPDVFAIGAVVLRVVLGADVTEDLRSLLAVNDAIRGHGSQRGHTEVQAWFAGPPPERADELSRLARDLIANRRHRLRDPALWLLERLVGGSAEDRGELLSFLLFGSEFATAAQELGAAHATETGHASGWLTP